MNPKPEIIDITDLEVNEPAQAAEEFNKSPMDATDLSKLSIFVAIPCHDGRLYSDTATALLQTLSKCMTTQLGINIKFLNSDSLITRARNHLVSLFMSTEATHLFFIDSDIIFTPDAFLKLILNDREICCASYPTKVSIATGNKARSVVGIRDKALIDDRGLVEADKAGTGFMCVKREVIKKMQEHHKELHYSQDYDTLYLQQFSQLEKENQQALRDNLFSLFDTMHHSETNEYLSEDYAFCKRWNDLGGKVWLDCNVNLGHIGNVTYVTDIQKALQEDQGEPTPLESKVLDASEQAINSKGLSS